VTSAATARNLIAPILRLGYRIRVVGAHRLPSRGPLLVVAPHQGFLDAALMSTGLSRPVHVLVEPGPVAARTPGRIVVEPEDPGTALRAARGLLESGQAVGAWSGEGHELAAGYLAVRCGSPVLPIAIFGGGGAHATDPPRWRSCIDIVVGDPFAPGLPTDGAPRQEIASVAEVIRQHVADHARQSQVRIGRLDGVGVPREATAPDNGLS